MTNDGMKRSTAESAKSAKNTVCPCSAGRQACRQADSLRYVTYQPIRVGSYDFCAVAGKPDLEYTIFAGNTPAAGGGTDEQPGP